MRRALLIATVAVLALPAQAYAHATLERTSPGFEQRLGTSPRTVTLHCTCSTSWRARQRSLTRSGSPYSNSTRGCALASDK